MRSIHLVCNAHIDPVWLWEWQEGAAAAIGTFRAAADFCEQYEGFVFNHNEVILYRWVEEYEPQLFKRIQRLIQQGRWHIMGGWFLQPDCNMPSGESFVRQILLGRQYFREKFGVRPTVAINIDPFGHTRGLVQIMARSGYRGYLFCRPFQVDCTLERDEFVWEGYDGSRLLAVRASEFYNSPLGKAGEKLAAFVGKHPDEPVNIMLWGVGNHGGGPSRQDIETLNGMMGAFPGVGICHSTPEDFFNELEVHRDELPVHSKDLNIAGLRTSCTPPKKCFRRPPARAGWLIRRLSWRRRVTTWLQPSSMISSPVRRSSRLRKLPFDCSITDWKSFLA
jgi:alpha-mannosidase